MPDFTTPLRRQSFSSDIVAVGGLLAGIHHLQLVFPRVDLLPLLGVSY